MAPTLFANLREFYFIEPAMKKLCFLGLLLCLLLFRSLPAAIFVVNVTHSQGPGSFRAALTSANASPGRDTIQFALVGVGPFVIRPDSISLPINVISDPLLIDGLSQAGTVYPNLQVILEGAAGYRIELNASDVEVQGIHWRNYHGHTITPAQAFNGSLRDAYFHHNFYDQSSGMELHGGNLSHITYSDNRLGCYANFITGYLRAGSSLDSVFIHHNTNQCTGATNNYLLSLDMNQDVMVDGLWVEDNQLTGTITQQQINGVYIRIGGSMSMADTVRNLFFRRNVISGSIGRAFVIEMRASNHHLLSNVLIDSNRVNYLRTGIQFLHHGSAYLPCMMRDITITHNQIRYCELKAIDITGELQYLPPKVSAVLIADNEIRFNQTDGIYIRTDYASSQSIAGIHFDGIQVLRNHIAQNGNCGILVSDANSYYPLFGTHFQGIAFRENSIHDNGWQGIMANGRFPSDTLTCRLPVPHLSHISPQAPHTVYGTLSGRANTSYRIEFFANAAPDVSGFGEGQYPIGTDTILLDPQGNGLIAWPAGASVPLHVSALATSLFNGNSSCFSNTVDTMTVGILDRNMAAPKVWPNPVVDEKLYFESPMPIDRLTLYNALGTQIANPGWERAGNGGVVHCGHLSPGVYLLRMESGDGSWTHKLVVE